MEDKGRLVRSVLQSQVGALSIAKGHLWGLRVTLLFLLWEREMPSRKGIYGIFTKEDGCLAFRGKRAESSSGKMLLHVLF